MVVDNICMGIVVILMAVWLCQMVPCMSGQVTIYTFILLKTSNVGCDKWDHLNNKITERIF